MKNAISKIGAWLSILPLLLLPTAAFAQIDAGYTNLTDVGAASGLGTGNQGSLPNIIGALINVLLSVLGIVLLVMVVYAGYTYMMAGGDEEKTKKAKKMLANAVIGIVLIVAAYAISTFVLDAIATAVA